MSDAVRDVLVVGGGPAGAAAARALARAGGDVLLVDRARFPRPKTCGACLAPAALAALEEAGLGDLPSGAGAVPLRTLRVRRGARVAELPIAGAVLSRERLDALLLDAARAAGAAVREGARAVAPLDDAPSGRVRITLDLPARALVVPKNAPVADARYAPERELEPGTRVEREHALRAQAQEPVRARAVVLATGLAGARTRRRSEPARDGGGAERHARLGAGFAGPLPEADLEPGVVDMVLGREGYVGRVLLEDGRVDAACALAPAAVQAAGGLGPAAARLLASAGRPDADALADAAWRGTPLLRRRADPAPDGAYLVGDAASYVEPFTGEGIAWALAGGAAVAPIALLGWTPELARRWRREHARVVAARQASARAFAWLLHHPRLAAAGVAVAAALPRAGGALARRVQRVERRGTPSRARAPRPSAEEARA